MKHGEQIWGSLALVSTSVYYLLYNLNPINPSEFPIAIIALVAPLLIALVGIGILALKNADADAWLILVVFVWPFVLSIATLMINVGYESPPPQTSYICNHLVTSITLYPNGTSIVHSMTQLYNGSYWHGTWSC